MATRNLNNAVKTLTNGKAEKLSFYVARRFRFLQVLEAWILGTLKVFCQIRFYVIPRFRIRQIFMCFVNIYIYIYR